ncbi:MULTISPECIES: class I SAM-dependent methyltransferase [Haloferacaceae]|uniref:Class I SAM-dependent methyltransferase n=1 Tax=Halorubrum glutamatedens TaxID=2707018 RepID=A0ABD5QW82_9EURY|nr:class I SAM-dependent methyltransferase [Halobellus captivus]
MTRPSTYEHSRYLEAKRTVDDRALHRPTLDRLREALAVRSADARDAPLRVVEVGCGTGSMLRRLLEWGVLPDEVVYRGYDLREESVDRAVEELKAWAEGVKDAEGTGYALGEVRNDPEATRTVRLDGPDGSSVTATFAAADAVEVARRTDAAYDLLVGCAFLDLVDIDRALDPLLGLVPDGFAYFPITYDGETFLVPSLEGDGTVDEATERAVLDVYHATMDAPDRAGGSRTGRELFPALPAADAEVVAGGGSDWLVTPPYPGEEAYFLHHLVDGIEEAVGGALADGSPAVADEDTVDRLSPGMVGEWADARHCAITNGQLTFGAHNLDVLAHVESDD